MPVAIPITGTTIRMGGVYAAYTAGAYPPGGTNVSLNAMLGVSKSALKSLGAATPLSATFGGRAGPFNYI